MVLAIHNNHPLANEEHITLRALEQYPSVRLLLGETLQNELDHNFLREGIYPKTHLVTDHFHLALNILRQNTSWALVPERSQFPLGDSMLCKRQVEDLDVRRYVFLERNPDYFYSKAVQLFQNFVQSYFNGKQEGVQ